MPPSTTPLVLYDMRLAPYDRRQHCHCETGSKMFMSAVRSGFLVRQQAAAAAANVKETERDAIGLPEGGGVVRQTDAVESQFFSANQQQGIVRRIVNYANSATAAICRLMRTVLK